MQQNASAEPAGQSDAIPRVAGPASREFRQTAANVLICYLFAHAGALTVLALIPITIEITGERHPGLFYLNILDLGVAKVATYFLSPLILGVTAVAFWNADMRRKRNTIISLALLGAAAAFLLYALLYSWELGRDLWEAVGPPNKEQFKDLAGDFAWQNALVFFGVILGIFGAELASKRPSAP